MKTRRIVSLATVLALTGGIVLSGSAAANAVTVQGPGTDCFAVFTKTLTSTTTDSGAPCIWTQAGIYRYVSNYPTLYVGQEKLDSYVSNSTGVNAGNQGRIHDSSGTGSWDSF